ncbi:Tautomerase enzyme [Allostreptomyces psammosilenae]|uniref:Phenylpyruvate tautomerase PptA (4-oxalocrotonate tautomerase family) n=1 Tax=Allostreptomyces psammosilenae TaxID=1892865 RepID=A0A853A2W3_9ACTN|nr:Tautomerase enzyme [Allostreptomyces psammosilenae]NYI04852.1 phenylpyruvate tautomerase PptA (4-oxalocrotonate tautomerase family) [Allostreptomyces psammosilenae]
MPMLDVYIPDGALEPEAEAALVNRITEILIRHEGFDPADPVTRAVSWVFVHRPAAVYVGGGLADAPRYKVVPSVPEGQLDERGRAGVVAEITEAILDAENGEWPRDPGRIWVFPTEIPEGHWGGRGRITPLAAILTRLTGHDAERAHALAAERIATSRAEHARVP